MKRKRALILTSVLVGAALLFTTAFASVTGMSGYDMYKSALKNMKNVKNVTASGTLSVTDNGKELVNATIDAKADKDSKSMNSKSTVSVNGKTKSVETYAQDGQMIVKTSDSDVYNVIKKNPNKTAEKRNINRENKGAQMEQDAEKVIDTIAGNFKSYISTSSEQDKNVVTLSMTGDQISPVMNAIASFAVKSMGRENHEGAANNQDKIMNDLKLNLPKLTDGIKIDNVSLKAAINKDNLIESQTGTVTIEGKDAAGVNHVIVINANINLSDYNNTKPEKIDLAGKKIKEVQAKEFTRGEGHGKRF